MDRLRRSKILPGLERAWAGCVAAAAVGLAVAPMAWLIAASMSEPGAFNIQNPLQGAAGVKGYLETLGMEEYRRALANSAAVSALAATAAMAAAMPAACAMARWNPPAWRPIVALLAIAFTLPELALALPLKTAAQDLGQNGARLAMAMACQAKLIPLAVVMAKVSFRGTPREAIDAAILEGCGGWRMLTRILAPKAKWGLAAAWAVCFALAWNDLATALALQPGLGGAAAPLVLERVQQGAQSPEAAAAGAAITLAPAILALALLKCVKWRA